LVWVQERAAEMPSSTAKHTTVFAHLDLRRQSVPKEGQVEQRGNLPKVLRFSIDINSSVLGYFGAGFGIEIERVCETVSLVCILQRFEKSGD
jgi:hypothetical protein